MWWAIKANWYWIFTLTVWIYSRKACMTCELSVINCKRQTIFVRRMQEELLARLALDHAEQLRGLSSQLLLLEAGLCRKQKDIRTLLNNRDTCVLRQSRTIRALQRRLADSGLDSSLPDSDDLDVVADNDSDSAVVLEDGTTMDLQLVLPLSSVLRYNSATAAVQRSISDATKFSSSGKRIKLKNVKRSQPNILF